MTMMERERGNRHLSVVAAAVTSHFVAKTGCTGSSASWGLSPKSPQAKSSVVDGVIIHNGQCFR